MNEINRGEDKNDGKNVCVNYYLVLDNWTAGDHIIEWKFTLDKPMNSGTESFEEGYSKSYISKIIILSKQELDIKEDRVKYSYVFSQEDNNFLEDDFSNSYREGRLFVKTGKLLLEITKMNKSSSFWFGGKFFPLLDQYDLSIDAKSTHEITGNLCFGLFINSLNLEYPYYKYILCRIDGVNKIVLIKKNNANFSQTIISKVLSNTNLSSSNKFRVIRNGNHYQFILNDDSIYETDLANYKKVKFGFSFEGERGGAFTIEFENLTLEFPKNLAMLPIVSQ